MFSEFKKLNISCIVNGTQRTEMFDISTQFQIFERAKVHDKNISMLVFKLFFDDSQ